eukprot:1139867-Ditylum_brightwellii.AAC.1
MKRRVVERTKMTKKKGERMRDRVLQVRSLQLDPEALSLELSLKTKGYGNLAHGSFTTRDQQYVAVFSPAFELQTTGRQAHRDCPPTHPS